MMIYQDAVVSADGTRVITFRGGIEKLQGRLSPFADIAWIDWWTVERHDYAILNGRRLSELTTFGNYPICFDYRDGSLLVQHNPPDGWLTYYDRNGRMVGAERRHVAADSGGIHHIEATGRIVMSDDPTLRRVMPNGELWVDVIETEHWVVGAFGSPDNRFPAALARLEKATGIVTRWLGKTQLPHRAFEFKGKLYVVVSCEDAPLPDAMEWVANFPAPEPVPVPPVVVTPPQAPVPPISIPPDLPVEPLPEPQAPRELPKWLRRLKPPQWVIDAIKKALKLQ